MNHPYIVYSIEYFFTHPILYFSVFIKPLLKLFNETSSQLHRQHLSLQWYIKWRCGWLRKICCLCSV